MDADVARDSTPYMHDYSSKNQQSLVEIIEDYFAFHDGSAERELGRPGRMTLDLKDTSKLLRKPLKSDSTIVGVVTNATVTSHTHLETICKPTENP